MKHPIMYFSPVSYYCLQLRPKYLQHPVLNTLSTLFSKTLNVWSILNVRHLPVQARQYHQHTDCIYCQHTDRLRKNCNNNDFIPFYFKLDNFNVLKILLI